MGSAVLEGGLSADIHEICFQAAKLLNMDSVELQGGLFVDSLDSIFRSRTFKVFVVTSSKRVVF